MPRPLVALPSAISFLALATAASRVAGHSAASFLLVSIATFSTAHGTP